jgi:uncharacterized protein (DUF983 family)
MKKGQKLYSILGMKCPRCHEGNLFSNKHPFPLSEMGKMPETCPNCGLKYEREPSFFYGSMYVSYGYSVAVFVAVYIISSLFLGFDIWTTVGILAAVLILVSPWVFRLSRSTWINLFEKYDPSFNKSERD